MKTIKSIAFILIAAFILLTIVFLWQEDFDLSKKINDQKVSNFFVTLFTIVGTVSTIYFTLKQYKLTEKTTISAIKPDIFIPNNLYIKSKNEEIKMYDGPQKGQTVIYAVFADFWSWDNSVRDITLENKGVGIVKSITATWNYNTEIVHQFYNGLYEVSKYERLTFKQEYLNSKDTLKIDLPRNYLLCFAPSTFRSKNLSKLSNIKTEKAAIPSLTLDIDYLDLQDNKYSDKYDVLISSNYDGISNITINFMKETKSE